MIEWLPDYLLRSILAGLGLALVAGPLGALVVWQRMAYFGDALAHASLLGVALSLFFSINVTLGVLAIALIVALLLMALQAQSSFASDTLLGLLSHTGLALGLLCFSLLPGSNIDLLAFLYGDILAVTWFDVALIALGGLIVLSLLAWIWSSLIRIIIHPDLAAVEGIPVSRVRLLFTILLAFVVAVGIKIVGVLLMTAMLIIPAATARFHARSPMILACIATLSGMISVLLGMGISHSVNVPTGPAMVAMMAALFLVSLLFYQKER